jgi:hypothetical protein
VRPEASAACGSAWAALWDRRGRPAAAAREVEKVLSRLATRAAHRAAGELLEHLAASGRVRSVERLLRSCGDWLASDDFSWGAAGYALHRAGRHRQALAWMAGWRDRAGLRVDGGNLCASRWRWAGLQASASRGTR